MGKITNFLEGGAMTRCLASGVLAGLMLSVGVGTAAANEATISASHVMVDLKFG